MLLNGEAWGAPDRRVGVIIDVLSNPGNQLAEQGFETVVEEESPELFWCHLERDGRRVAPMYGRGTNPAEAVESAWNRYRTEEFGDAP
jgi:hypothetical protein